MKLSKFYKPKKNYKLNRYGKDYDGGYLIGKKSILKSRFLVSYGISDDWTFELDILKKNKNIKIFSFDNNLSYKLLFKLILLNFFRLFYFNSNLKKLFDSIKKFLKFKIVKNQINFKNKTIKNKDTLLITKNLDDLLLKIDIEGSEYRILDDLIKIKKKINGLIIELHDIDLHHNKIKKFINNLGLHLTHIHPNNYSEPDKYGNPTTVEITFEKYPIILGKKVKLPNKLDMKSNPRSIDYNLKFQN